jgi:hypothetical protein
VVIGHGGGFLVGVVYVQANGAWLAGIAASAVRSAYSACKGVSTLSGLQGKAEFATL